MHIHIADKSISLNELCRVLEIQPVNSMDVVIDNGKGQSIVTTLSDDADFPYVDSYGISGKTPYSLARLELPNREFPEDFTVRLYGGNEKYEAADWIALVKSNAFGKSVTGKLFSSENELTKIIYVDKELATAKGLHDFSTDVPYNRLPEHKEDIEG